LPWYDGIGVCTGDGVGPTVKGSLFPAGLEVSAVAGCDVGALVSRSKLNCDGSDVTIEVGNNVGSTEVFSLFLVGLLDDIVDDDGASVSSSFHGIGVGSGEDVVSGVIHVFPVGLVVLPCAGDDVAARVSSLISNLEGTGVGTGEDVGSTVILSSFSVGLLDVAVDAGGDEGACVSSSFDGIGVGSESDVGSSVSSFFPVGPAVLAVSGVDVGTGVSRSKLKCVGLDVAVEGITVSVGLENDVG
jgi:hypothetical protein